MAGARWTQVRAALMDVVQRIVTAQESAASVNGIASAGGRGRAVEADGVQIAFLNSPVEGFNLTVSTLLVRSPRSLVPVRVGIQARLLRAECGLRSRGRWMSSWIFVGRQPASAV
jgi:hypothetical protein